MEAVLAGKRLWSGLKTEIIRRIFIRMRQAVGVPALVCGCPANGLGPAIQRGIGPGQRSRGGTAAGRRRAFADGVRAGPNAREVDVNRVTDVHFLGLSPGCSVGVGSHGDSDSP